MIRIVQLAFNSDMPPLTRPALFCDSCGSHITNVDGAGYFFDVDQPFMGQVLVMHNDCAHEVERRRGQRFMCGDLTQLFDWLPKNAKPTSEWR